jgi:hypothetical protein
MDFLNVLLKEERGEIKHLTYLKSEQLGINDSDRKAIFDLYCEKPLVRFSLIHAPTLFPSLHP